MSQEIRIKLFINSSYNTFPKYIFIPSQAMIFFVFISTLVDKDTGLCIGPVDHFQNNQKAIHLEKKIFLYGRIWNAFYKYLPRYQPEYNFILSIHLQTIKFTSIFLIAH